MNWCSSSRAWNLLLLLALAPLSGCPAAWVSYGHDPGNSRSNPEEEIIFPETVGGLRELWDFQEIAVTSTPIAPDPYSVYYGTWDGQLHARLIETGALAWSRQLTDSYISASALAPHEIINIDWNGNGEVDPGDEILPLYIADADGVIHALNRLNGALLWSVELDPHPATNIFGSPILVDGHLIIGVSSTEVSEQKADYTFRGSVVSLDPTTGEEQWRFYTNQMEDGSEAGAGVSVWSTPAVDPLRQTIYVGTGNSYEAPAGPYSDALIALRIDTGELVWSRQFTADDVFSGSNADGHDFDLGASPVLYQIGGRDVVAAADKGGRVAAFDRDTGETIWWVEPRLPGNDVGGSHLGGVMASPAFANGVLFVNSNFWGSPNNSPTHPLNTSGTFALDGATGEVLWYRDMDSPCFGAIAEANSVIFLGTLDGEIHALDASDGSELWSDTPGKRPRNSDRIGGGAAISFGRVFVGYGFPFFGSNTDNPSGGLKAYHIP